MPSSAPETRLGDTIGGRYRVISVLGRGGMGVLYAAEHQLTQRKVALKLLAPEREDLPELHQRFLLEARTAAAVRHPHVVDVLDMGVHDDGSPFLVMELLEGTSLDRTLTVQKRLSPEQALTTLLPVLGALASLHDAGIVHRDVKPSNIFLAFGLRGELVPKLLDFGLARTMSDLRLTRSGMVLGTPLYMSPEQAAGETVSFQTDLWSLGVVMFECLSGELPFTSRDSGAIAAQVLAGRVRGLAQVSPELPVPLAHAVDRALRRDLSLRYRDMREFARGLIAAALACGVALPENPDPVGLPEFREWRGQASVPSTMAAAKPVPLAGPEVSTEPDSAVAPITDARSVRHKSRGAVVAVLVGAIVLAVCAAWLWPGVHQAPSPREPLRVTEQGAKPSMHARPGSAKPAEASVPEVEPIQPQAEAPPPLPPPPASTSSAAKPANVRASKAHVAKPKAHAAKSKAESAPKAESSATSASSPLPSKADTLGIEREWK
jgi:serine/threonine-protein kinase